LVEKVEFKHNLLTTKGIFVQAPIVEHHILCHSVMYKFHFYIERLDKMI